jgi:pumilio homology domain family member 6
VFKHDASRVVQSVVKYAKTDYCNEIVKELSGRLVELSKSTYSRFLVVRLLSKSTSLRENIINEFLGHVSRLVRHVRASRIIEAIYTEYANSKQRYHMLQELYHSEFKNFKTMEPLSELIKKRDISSIISSLQAAIVPCLDKGTIGDLTIIQRAFVDYVELCNLSLNPKLIAEANELLERVPIIVVLHTKEGARLSMLAISAASNKRRRQIAKEMKTYVTKIACEEYGHKVLIQLFDTVDDTVMIDQNILRELDFANSLPLNQYARRLALFILAGRSTRHFHPACINELQQNGKKDAFRRYNEIRAASSEKLLSVVVPRLEAWLCDPKMAVFTIEVLMRTIATLEDEDKDAATTTTAVKTDEISTSKSENKIASLRKQAVKTIAEILNNNKIDRTFIRYVRSLISYHRIWTEGQVKAKISEGYTDEGRIALGSEIASTCADYTIQLFQEIGEVGLTKLAFGQGAYVALAFVESKSTSATATAWLKNKFEKISKNLAPGASLLAFALPRPPCSSSVEEKLGK